ncbi:hypothetical protein L484_012641 [Morus notabilis]|uniref:Uncharacterized protein n=1 Tax=Morus notabilis TaxID=981085 RepID=W9S9R7_9ROSA|nr:hypothetical protein L484_012641 [Morus notabilis]
MRYSPKVLIVSGVLVFAAYAVLVISSKIRGVDLKKREDTNDEKVVGADEYYRESEKNSSSDWIGPISLGIKINHCYLHRSGSTNFKHFHGGQGHGLGRDCTMPLSRRGGQNNMPRETRLNLSLKKTKGWPLEILSGHLFFPFVQPSQAATTENTKKIICKERVDDLKENKINEKGQHSKREDRSWIGSIRFGFKKSYCIVPRGSSPVRFPFKIKYISVHRCKELNIGEDCNEKTLQIREQQSSHVATQRQKHREHKTRSFLNN